MTDGLLAKDLVTRGPHDARSLQPSPANDRVCRLTASVRQPKISRGDAASQHARAPSAGDRWAALSNARVTAGGDQSAGHAMAGRGFFRLLIYFTARRHSWDVWNGGPRWACRRVHGSMCR